MDNPNAGAAPVGAPNPQPDDGSEAALEPPPSAKPLAPGLYLVSTPIGNLEDITLRALRVLRSADRIACEDTRQTAKLLSHFGIRIPTVSYHLHNEKSRSNELLEALRAGGRIALVSDAGTPGIADPGATLVSAALQAGIAVFPIPGASAVLSALVPSGLNTESFAFHGFLPSRAGQRRNALESLQAQMTAPPGSQLGAASPAVSTTHIFYETPHRILDALTDVVATFGPAHHIVLARELTKLHEEFLRGSAAGLLSILQQRPSLRGEFVLLLEGSPTPDSCIQPPQLSLADEIAQLLRNENLTEKEALKRIAKSRGLGKSEAYREWQRTRR